MNWRQSSLRKKTLYPTSQTNGKIGFFANAPHPDGNIGVHIFFLEQFSRNVQECSALERLDRILQLFTHFRPFLFLPHFKDKLQEFFRI